MPHAEHTVTVNRPPREIFDYLADGTNNRAWRGGVVGGELLEGAGTPGVADAHTMASVRACFPGWF